MKYKAILWDVGGTLVRYGVPISVSVRRRFDDCNLDHRTICDEQIAATLRDYLANERTWRTRDDEHRARLDWVAKLFDGCALSDEQRVAAAHALGIYYDVHAPVAGILELIDDLGARGMKQAIVSNWPPSLPQFLKHHGFASRFAVVCFSAEDGIHKPDERIFHRAMMALGVKPRETIMVGDNIDWDITPARAMGMAAIHFDPRKMRENREADDVPALRKLLGELLDAR
jgi:HAD superfamily hydrolase (TIGR01509 family)